MKHIGIKIALVFCFFFVSGGKVSEASENKLSFTPIVKQTEEKMDDSTTDIKLKGKPGEKVNLWVTVTNESKESLSMVAELKDAATNNQGIVQYTSDKPVLNKKLSLAKLANYNEKFKLSPGETRDIKVSVTLPEENFEGILLGGLHLKQEADTASKQQIKNSFSYSIPVVVVESEELINADLTFDSVIPELTAGKNALKVSLNNPISVLLSNADYKVAVRKKQSDKVLYQDTLKEVSFAPNSQFSHYVLMDKSSYEAGTYVADIKVSSQYGDWKWKKEFTIDKKVADQLNKESISVPRMSLLLKLMIIGAAVLFILVLALLIYIVKIKRIVN